MASGEPRLITITLLCQNEACHETLGQGHMPWTTGRLDLICWKCKMVSRYRPTDDGIVAFMVPPSENALRKR